MAGIGIADEIRVRDLIRSWPVHSSSAADVVVASVPPFSLTAVPILTRAPVILDYRDVFGASLRLHPLARAGAPLEARAARRASAITYAGSRRIGELMGSMTRLPAERIRPVPNGVNMSEVATVERRTAPVGRLQMVISGHLYGFADLTPLLSAMGRAGPGAATLEIIGPTPAAMRERYAVRSDASVAFSAPLTRRALYQKLVDADLGVIVLNAGYPHEISIPAKFYDYIACGLPVLYIGPTDAALRSEPGGAWLIHFEPIETGRIANFLRRAATDRGILPSPKNITQEIDRSIGANLLVDLAEKLLCETR